jgi:hypothetical protein
MAEPSPRGLRGTAARPLLPYQRSLCHGVVTVVLNGVVVAGFGVVTLALYVDLSAAELSLFAACSAVGYAVEGLVAAAYLRRAALPARAWLAGEGGEGGEDCALQAWSAAAQLPLALLRRPTLYGLGVIGAAAVDLLSAALPDLPAYVASLLEVVVPTNFPIGHSLRAVTEVCAEVALR